jgi:hypothetical protein
VPFRLVRMANQVALIGRESERAGELGLLAPVKG